MRLTLLPVLAGSALFLGAGYAATVVAPTASSADADAARSYSIAAVKGQDVYAAQGCVYCHTTQVRDAYTDAGLEGEPTTRDSTLADRPGALGEVRYGPDLSCIGNAVPGAASDDTEGERVRAMMSYLRDPDSVHPGGAMPAYDYLSDDELRRLASYLVDHVCEDSE